MSAKNENHQLRSWNQAIVWPYDCRKEIFSWKLKFDRFSVQKHVNRFLEPYEPFDLSNGASRRCLLIHVGRMRGHIFMWGEFDFDFRFWNLKTSSGSMIQLPKFDHRPSDLRCVCDVVAMLWRCFRKLRYSQVNRVSTAKVSRPSLLLNFWTFSKIFFFHFWTSDSKKMLRVYCLPSGDFPFA